MSAPVVAVTCSDGRCRASVSWYEWRMDGTSAQPHRIATSVARHEEDPLLCALRQFRVDYVASCLGDGVPAAAYAAPGRPPGYLSWPCGSPVQWAPSLLPCPCPRHRQSGTFRLPVVTRGPNPVWNDASPTAEFFSLLDLRAAHLIDPSHRADLWMWEIESAPADWLHRHHFALPEHVRHRTT